MLFKLAVKKINSHVRVTLVIILFCTLGKTVTQYYKPENTRIDIPIEEPREDPNPPNPTFIPPILVPHPPNPPSFSPPIPLPRLTRK